MNRGLKLFMIFCLMVLIISFPALSKEEIPAEDTSTDMLTLPAGTPVRLILQERLYSQRNREGDEIIFITAEDIVMMGRTYLVAGTPVIGRVTNQSAARSWGRGGNLDIEITSIMPLYSMPIPLSGQAGQTGGSEMGTSVREVLAVAPALLGNSGGGGMLGGLDSGSGAVIEAGTVMIVFSAQDAEIMDISEDEMREYVDNWLVGRVRTGFLNYSWDGNCSVAMAMANLGYDIEDSDITIEPFEAFQYRVTVRLSDTQTAVFTLQPFEEPHLGKFKTLEPQDDLAEAIFMAVR